MGWGWLVKALPVVGTVETVKETWGAFKDGDPKRFAGKIFELAVDVTLDATTIATFGTTSVFDGAARSVVKQAGQKILLTTSQKIVLAGIGKVAVSKGKSDIRHPTWSNLLDRNLCVRN